MWFIMGLYQVFTIQDKKGIKFIAMKKYSLKRRSPELELPHHTQFMVIPRTSFSGNMGYFNLLQRMQSAYYKPQILDDIEFNLEKKKNGSAKEHFPFFLQTGDESD